VFADYIKEYKIMKYQKHLIIVILSTVFFSCDTSLTHKITDSFEDGTVKTISVFKGSSLVQKIDFSNDTNILNRSFYKNGCLFGRWTSGEFFEDENLVLDHYGNGVLKSKGYIIDDNMHGHWSHYDRYGKLENDRYYFHGKPVGDWYSYHDGEVEVVHYGYVKGNGNWTEYYNADRNIAGEHRLLKKEISFFNNKNLSGTYEYYYKNGNLKLSGYYFDGKKDGEWNYYNENGNIVKTENYDKGLLNGDFKLFFDDGITEKLIGKYVDGKRIGTWFWFFDIDKKSNYKMNYSSN